MKKIFLSILVLLVVAFEGHADPSFSSRYDFVAFHEKLSKRDVINFQEQQRLAGLIQEAFQRDLLPALLIEVPVSSAGVYTNLDGVALTSASSKTLEIRHAANEFIQNPEEVFIKDFWKVMLDNPKVKSVRLILNAPLQVRQSGQEGLAKARLDFLAQLEQKLFLVNQNEVRPFCHNQF